ncbi:MAG: hypothetical protein R2688_10315 [Fimbriimonadaceae bacterium]
MAQKKKFLLRLSPQLYDDLQRLADDEFRSVNAQIELMLHEAVRHRVGGKKRQLPPEPDEDADDSSVT